MGFLRSRMLVVVLGMLIVSGLGAAVAVIASSSAWQTALIGASASNDTPATATATIAGTSAATASATATTPRATNTPVVKPLPTQTTPPPSVRGTVVSVDANAGQFVVSSNGGNVKVLTTGATTFSGAASSLSALSSGMRVRVQGASQANGDFLATSVNSSIDN